MSTLFWLSDEHGSELDLTVDRLARIDVHTRGQRGHAGRERGGKPLDGFGSALGVGAVNADAPLIDAVTSPTMSFCRSTSAISTGWEKRP
jgi:hypothetical protein